MTQPSIFLGLVTYQGSRYPNAKDSTGLTVQLAEELDSSQVVIHDTDLVDEATIITSQSGRSSGWAEIRADYTWARFLGIRHRPGWWMVHGLRWVKGLSTFMAPTRPAAVKRLLNIELAHIRLMERGLESEAPWILIMEDDAATTDAADLAAGLRGIMQSSKPPAFVNISESFDIRELRINHLLTEAAQTWQGSQTRQILTASRPITNTVCAILYRKDFLTDLVRVLKDMPVEPVIPIDWKLNLALIALFQNRLVAPHECWIVEPGPIVQRSIHGVGSHTL